MAKNIVKIYFVFKITIRRLIFLEQLEQVSYIPETWKNTKFELLKRQKIILIPKICSRLAPYFRFLVNSCICWARQVQGISSLQLFLIIVWMQKKTYKAYNIIKEFQQKRNWNAKKWWRESKIMRVLVKRMLDQNFQRVLEIIKQTAPYQWKYLHTCKIYSLIYL